MIRRLARRLLLALPLVACAGCAVSVSGNAVTGIFLIPILVPDDETWRMQRTGGYTDSRWFASPDSHPAVQARPGSPTRPTDSMGVVLPPP